VREKISSLQASKSTINSPKCGVSLLVAPGIETPVQVQLGELHVFEEAVEQRHEPAIEPIIVLVHRFINVVKIPTQQPWTNATIMNTFQVI
jgi:hypothetical protein